MIKEKNMNNNLFLFKEYCFLFTLTNYLFLNKKVIKQNCIIKNKFCQIENLDFNFKLKNSQNIFNKEYLINQLNSPIINQFFIEVIQHFVTDFKNKILKERIKKIIIKFLNKVEIYSTPLKENIGIFIPLKNGMIFFDESLLENIKNMDNNREIEKTLQCLILQIEIFVLMSYFLVIIFNGKSNQKNEFFNQEEIEKYFFKKLICQHNISLANEELFFSLLI